MADLSDVRRKIDDARRYAIEEGPAEARIRSLDGIEMLLIEVIGELRDISEKLDKRPAEPS